MTDKLSEFQFIKKIGDGAYSQVYKVKRKNDGKVYALKKVRMNSLNEKEKQNALNEVRIIASIHSTYVIAYKEAFVTDNSLCIVMEFCDYGDLFEKINTHKKAGTSFSEEDIWQVFMQTLVGLNAMHQLDVLHRDIKSANIFMNRDGTSKLGDMNVSKVAKDGMLSTQTGTPYYASPEVWRDKPYNCKSDIWSLGCVVYEMCALKPPFRADDMQGLYKKVLKGQYPRIPAMYSHELSNVIKLMLNVSASTRLDSNQLMKLPAVEKRLSKLKSDNPADDELLKTIRMDRNYMALSKQLPKPSYNSRTLSPSKIGQMNLSGKEGNENSGVENVPDKVPYLNLKPSSAVGALRNSSVEPKIMNKVYSKKNLPNPVERVNMSLLDNNNHHNSHSHKYIGGLNGLSSMNSGIGIKRSDSIVKLFENSESRQNENSKPQNIQIKKDKAKLLTKVTSNKNMSSIPQLSHIKYENDKSLSNKYVTEHEKHETNIQKESNPGPVPKMVSKYQILNNNNSLKHLGNIHLENSKVKKNEINLSSITKLKEVNYSKSYNYQSEQSLEISKVHHNKSVELNEKILNSNDEPKPTLFDNSKPASAINNFKRQYRPLNQQIASMNKHLSGKNTSMLPQLASNNNSLNSIKHKYGSHLDVRLQSRLSSNNPNPSGLRDSQLSNSNSNPSLMKRHDQPSLGRDGQDQFPRRPVTVMGYKGPAKLLERQKDRLVNLSNLQANRKSQMNNYRSTPNILNYRGVLKDKSLSINNSKLEPIKGENNAKKRFVY